jgi:EmrB/QacA subfamily drug resistance transporter
VFAISTDTTIVNVALPTLVRSLHASTRDLQWIVDAYNLTFAAFVLAAGSLADRYGRRGALLSGLAVFGGASTVAAFVTSTTALIAARAVMGLGAAIIFPATLSILSNVFVDRQARAKAIGIWGAATGLGVAFGPITGGWLLEHFSWGSVFLVMGPVAAVTGLLAITVVPPSRDPSTPRLDVGGLGMSTAAIGALVYTVIEAPERGWLSAATIVGFALAGAILATFVLWENREAEPMLDVRLFSNLRFSAASGSVTVAYFALFGFIFMVTQYFQFVKAYTPLGTGVRMIPVAASIAISSILGARLAVSIGNKAVIAGGLGLLTVAYVWMSRSTASTAYVELAGQMILLGTGMGLTSTTATEAIMGAVPKDKAGIGSAVNDATRELGGTLGVAVIGSVFASLYGRAMRDPVLGGLPAAAIKAAREGIGSAYVAAGRMTAAGAPQGAVDTLLRTARRGFFDGLSAGALVAAGVTAAGAVFALAVLPNRPVTVTDDIEVLGEADETEPVELTAVARSAR